MSISYDAHPSFDLEFSATAAPEVVEDVDVAGVWRDARRLAIECACYAAAGLVAMMALGAMVG